MPKYLLIYTDSDATSGSEMMRPTEEESRAMIAAWTNWFTNLGAHVVDEGNPTSASSTLSKAGGSREGAAARITGYSLINADNMEHASELAKTCPALDYGDIQIYETFNVT